MTWYCNGDALMTHHTANALLLLEMVIALQLTIQCLL